MNKIKIGVIGAGSMGRGIAQHAITYGHEVVLVDINEKTLQNARAFIDKMINKMADKGQVQAIEVQPILSRLYPNSHLSSVEDCDLVIEAVIENLDLKKKIFNELEAIVSKEAILASNTSSLSITSIAATCQNPERVIGLHFFNPVPLMNLVEIIPAIQTDPALVDTCKNWMDEWMKIPVIAKDTPGFIVNKVARPFYSEALRLYDEGFADIPTIDQAMTENGFRMGPFTLMDYIGNDVNYAVTESVFQAFYYDQRYKPSLTQKRLSEAGWFGRKSGKGYYKYVDGKQMDTQSTDPSMHTEIFQRILVMLINEAADTYHMGIASINDIDLAVTRGVNYPKGLLRWADEIGIENVIHQIDDLYDYYHEDRYRCSAVLRNMAENKLSFYG